MMNKKMIAMALCAGFGIGAAYAKLPPAPPLSDEQKAEAAAKTKASADKEADLLGKYQDKAAAHYKKNKGAADAKAAVAEKKK